MEYMKKQTTNNRVQSKGWSHGRLTDKKRTSINLDSDIGKMIEKKSISQKDFKIQWDYDTYKWKWMKETSTLELFM